MGNFHGIADVPAFLAAYRHDHGDEEPECAVCLGRLSEAEDYLWKNK
jgi:hypothetical protein